MTKRQAIVRRGIRLEYLTIACNSVAAPVAVPSRLGAGSVWRLRADQKQTREHAERLALPLVGTGFLALAAYVTYDALSALVLGEPAERSRVGPGLRILSLTGMPALVRAKRRVVRGLSRGATEADSRQSDICACLSAILPGGLALNALPGLWWADAVAALGMVPLIAQAGIESVPGRTCGGEPVEVKTRL
jgi:hypothetical protein